MLRSTLGHTGYYRAVSPKLCYHYSTAGEVIEEVGSVLLYECDNAFTVLKEKLVSAPILVFPNWNIEFHVHVDTSGITLGAVLAQPGEGNLDHPVYFDSRKLSQAEHNYTTTEREGLAMVYALHKFHHYLLGGHFKFYTDRSALKYLVNKPVLEGRICRWLLLF